jgi:hypothetical protein
MYYSFDSRSWNGSGNQPPTSHQLPALLDVMLVACDEATAERVAGNGTMPADKISAFRLTYSVCLDAQKEQFLHSASNGDHCM